MVTMQRELLTMAILDPMLPRVYEVRQVHRDTADTFSLDLAPADGGEMPAEYTQHAPGQFNMLYVFGAGEVPISISGDPANRSSLIHTIRAVGAVRRVMSTLNAGDQIGIRGPFGTPWPVAAGRPAERGASGIS